MKIFSFIGKTLDHVESLTDSLATTVISASDTAGVYVGTAHEVALQERTVTVAEAMLEGELRLKELKARIAKAGEAVETTTSSASADAKTLLDSL